MENRFYPARESAAIQWANNHRSLTFTVDSVGIIGEPVSGFIAETLVPVGQDGQEINDVEIIPDDCSSNEIKPRYDNEG